MKYSLHAPNAWANSPVPLSDQLSQCNFLHAWSDMPEVTVFKCLCIGSDEGEQDIRQQKDMGSIRELDILGKRQYASKTGTI